MSTPATVGGPAALGHRRVLRIALPIVLSNATVPLLGAVDTGVIGQLGQAAPIGAVGMGAVILATFYWAFGFLRMGTSGLAAQATGAGDETEAALILLRALAVGAAAGLVFIAAQAPIFALAFAVSPASPEVEGLARAYLSIRIWGAPATIALYAVTGWLIARERTRGVLALQLWMNGLNMGLDVLFVLGLGWGVGGVATATLIAEWSGLALGLWLCRGAFAGGLWRDLGRLADGERLRRMAGVNGDIMLRSVLLQGAFTSFVFLGARFGDVTLAANQVLLQFLEVTAYALDGFAFAAESLVGQAVGQRSGPMLRRAALLTSQWGAGGAVALGLAFLFGGPWLIDLLTTEPAVRAAARGWLIWVALMPVLGIACWMLDGIFIGATRTRDMRNAMILTMLIYLPVLFLLPRLVGNHGLWAALALLMVLRGITLGRLYPRIARGLGG
ncbi:MAG: MATE family efflux transporter [Proteobacteria bacterium]|nr:MATE family efflux transporter [Pseudomonadota bacterium]MBS0572317.1 MATE family efflux transporter [Pseudomonadota bacterium]